MRAQDVRPGMAVSVKGVARVVREVVVREEAVTRYYADGTVGGHGLREVVITVAVSDGIFVRICHPDEELTTCAENTP